MVKDPVCGMTIDEKTAAGKSDVPGADLLLLRDDLQDEVRSGSEAIPHKVNDSRPSLTGGQETGDSVLKQD